MHLLVFTVMKKMIFVSSYYIHFRKTQVLSVLVQRFKRIYCWSKNVRTRAQQLTIDDKYCLFFCKLASWYHLYSKHPNCTWTLSHNWCISCIFLVRCNWIHNICLHEEMHKWASYVVVKLDEKNAPSYGPWLGSLICYVYCKHVQHC